MAITNLQSRLLGGCALCVAAAASASGDPLVLAVAELDPVVVTATRGPTPTVADGLAATSVISRRDIERRQVGSVEEALRGVPGLNLTNNGGPGKNTSIFLRGTNSDHLLVLLDGVEIGSATSGTAAFQNIPIEQVERIEVVRGPQSGLYGSDAIGGVIQIFTRGSETDGRRSYFELGGGSFDTYRGAAGVSGGGERGWFSLNTDVVDTAGIDSQTTFEPDDDGYRSLSVSGRGGLHLGRFGELRANALHADGESAYDGNPDFDAVNETETVQQVFGASWLVRPWEPLSLTIDAGRSEDRSRNFRNGDFRTRFDTSRNDFSVQADADLLDQRVSLGVDHVDERVDSTTGYDETRREITGVYAQLLGELGAFEYRLSGRTDDYDDFDNQQTGTAAIAWRMADRLRLRASYGTAFRAPSFNELYFPGFGNPDVAPEESRSVELGAEWSADIWSLRVAAFDTRIDDLIDTVQAPDGSFRPENVNEARVQGVELSSALDVADWELGVAYTYQRPENRGEGDNRGNRLRRRPDQILQFDADRRFGRLDAGMSVYAEGRRYENAANSQRLAGYVLLDARLGYQLSAAWRVQGRVENLLDSEYQTAATYNQPGRAVHVTLRYSM